LNLFIGKVRRVHFIMNLPAIATSFLKHLRGMLGAQNGLCQASSLPQVHIHCYYFAKKHHPPQGATDNVGRPRSQDELKVEAVEIVRREIDSDCRCDHFQLEAVRSVAPGKDMMRLTFALEPDLLFANCDR